MNNGELCQMNASLNSLVSQQRVVIKFAALLLAGFGAFTSDASAQVNSEKDANSADMQEITDAWSHRRQLVKSLQLSVKIDEVIKGRKGIKHNESSPFREFTPTTDLISEVHLSFSFDAGKLHFSRKSSPIADAGGSDAAVPQIIQIAFDGAENTELAESVGRNKIGSINVVSRPLDKAFTHTDFVPIGLWMNPQLILSKIGWRSQNISVEHQDSTSDGVKCCRLYVPRAGKKWASHLDVDPAREFVPIRWETILNGKAASITSIQYGNMPDFGPVISGWSCSQFDQNGELEVRRCARVIKAAINEPVDPKVFSIPFPVTTWVIKKVQGRTEYYQQSPIGLQPVNKRDFMKSRQASPPS